MRAVVVQRFPTLLLLVGLITGAGCSTSRRDRSWFNSEVTERLGGHADAAVTDDGAVLVVVDDAVVVDRVLRFQPQLRAELTRIDAARATLDEASRPTNPQLSLLGGFGLISTMASLVAPLESLWQLPLRSRAAAVDVDVTAESVLMRALDLVREARVALIDWRASIARAELRASLQSTASELARIASVRARVGETAALDERLLAADAIVATDNGNVAAVDAEIARARLAQLLAIDVDRLTAPAALVEHDEATLPALSTLIQLARAARPDARAAAFALDAAAARHGVEVGRVFNVSALVEGHWQNSAPAARLGARFEVPIFGANVGGLGRADADVARADAAFDVVARAVIFDVTVARARLAQAVQSRVRYEHDVLPALNDALEIAKRGFDSGDDSWLVVLDILRRVGDARLRHVELVAQQQRARCDLERAIGARLGVIDDVAARLAQQEDHR